MDAQHRINYLMIYYILQIFLSSVRTGVFMGANYILEGVYNPTNEYRILYPETYLLMPPIILLINNVNYEPYVRVLISKLRLLISPKPLPLKISPMGLCLNVFIQRINYYYVMCSGRK